MTYSEPIINSEYALNIINNLTYFTKGPKTSTVLFYHTQFLD